MENPYDELPYNTYPIEWTTPERLGLASLLHGGPRAPLQGYRVLELGCGDGGNLLPMAWYRPHASFVGIDGAKTQIDLGNTHATKLGLSNLRLLHADFVEAAALIEGHFDFIIAHGVFSWVPPSARDALLRLCAKHLSPSGLLYFNYNTKPGWAVRGMVREFLLAQTADIEDLRSRAEAARAVAHALAEGMGEEFDHPYRELMRNELAFVRDGHPSYVAHEFLAEHNDAYWRGDLLALMSSHGFDHVADADFEFPWGREEPEFTTWLQEQRVHGRGLPDTVDLLRYRQLHSPIFTRSPRTVREVTADELDELFFAANLEPNTATTFVHESGAEIEVSDPRLRDTFVELRQQWPAGRRVGEFCPPGSEFHEDLLLLHRNQLAQLRRVEPIADPGPDNPLNQLELSHSGYRTTPSHEWIQPKKG
ncbi:MAG: class I SAM-dependent methyltransferase [Myxococcota bacterium]